MFERGGDVGAIAIEKAVIAIVHDNYFARGGARQALDQGLRRLRFPIEAEARPGDDAQASRTDNGKELRAAKTVWWTHQAHRARRDKRSGTGFKSIEHGTAAALQFVGDRFAAEPDQIGVGIGVIGDDMAAGGDFADQFRALAGETADHEECGADTVAIKEIEEAWRNRGIGAVVESQRQRRALHIRQGGSHGAKKTRPRGYGAVAEKAGSARRDDGDRDGKGRQSSEMIACPYTHS